MLSVTLAQDVSGNEIEVGDTVVAVNGQSTGRVCEIAREDDLDFVCLRPVHQPYGKGTWYAADQVFWVARPGNANSGAKDAKKAAPSAVTRAGSTPSRPARATPAKKK